MGVERPTCNVGSVCYNDVRLGETGVSLLPGDDVSPSTSFLWRAGTVSPLSPDQTVSRLPIFDGCGVDGDTHIKPEVQGPKSGDSPDPGGNGRPGE